MPVILVVFDAIARKGYWLPIQRYFKENPSRRPRSGGKTVRVQFSSRQSVTRRAVRQMRMVKEEVLSRLDREL